MFAKMLRVSLSFILLFTLILLIGVPHTVMGAATTITMFGADVSTLQRGLDLGAKYFYADGKPGDALDILKDSGVNYIRLRIWNKPRIDYNNKAKVLEFAKIIKAKGLKLMVDFHYSDYWADPGKQFKPAAWADHTIDQLVQDVYDYTYDVCNSLKAQGTVPDSVQVGNEINTGMLWPEGQVVNDDFTSLGKLLKSGYKATKDCNSDTQVIIHTADADKDENARWFYDGIKAQGVEWDITALSYYSYWHGTMANMTSVVADMKSRYGKPVIIAETAYPFTLDNTDIERNTIYTSTQLDKNYPATETGQLDNLKDVMAAAEAGGAIGVFYWEPTWIGTTGNGWNPADPSSGVSWDNQALFNAKGVANPALAAFKPKES